MTRRRTFSKTRNNKKTARAKPLRMVRSSGEQPRDVKAALREKGRIDTAARRAAGEIHIL